MSEPKAPDYVEVALDLLGGEDTEFTVHVDRDAAAVMLSCESNGCKWGYTIGEIPLWELACDAREHWDKEHA